MTGRRSRQIIFVVVAIAVACFGRRDGFLAPRQPQTAKAAGPPAVPVIVTEATQHDVPIYYDALGTVTALNTVAIRAQVTGQIVSVDFRQGQDVRKRRCSGQDRSGAVQGRARPGRRQEKRG